MNQELPEEIYSAHEIMKNIDGDEQALIEEEKLLTSFLYKYMDEQGLKKEDYTTPHLREVDPGVFCCRWFPPALLATSDKYWQVRVYAERKTL